MKRTFHATIAALAVAAVGLFPATVASDAESTKPPEIDAPVEPSMPVIPFAPEADTDGEEEGLNPFDQDPGAAPLPEVELGVPDAALFPERSVLDESDEEIGFTWWNDVPELIRRGNKRFEAAEYDRAESLYRDAYLQSPAAAVSSFNLGLSRANLGDHSEALDSFQRSLNLANRAFKNEQEESAFRADTLYNLGRSHFEMAKSAMTDQEGGGEEAARKHAIEALDSFSRAQTFRSEFEDAAYNKAQVQHFLKTLAVPPPEQQQQSEGSGGDSEEDQQQEPQDGQGDQQQQQQDQQQQEGDESQDGQQQQDQGEQGDEQQEQDGSQGEQEQEEEQDGEGEEEEEQEGQGGQPQEPREMTPEEAKQLLNLLGNEKQINLKPRQGSGVKPQPAKDW